MLPLPPTHTDTDTPCPDASPRLASPRSPAPPPADLLHDLPHHHARCLLLLCHELPRVVSWR